MKVIIRGNWSNCVGTDYCDALGIYPNLASAYDDAEEYAWNLWQPQDEEDTGIEDEGPDYCIEEYDPAEHDNHRAGGGSFEGAFNAL